MSPSLGIGLETGGGRYVITEVIGQGGMGDVYKAHDRQLDRIVAIKAIRPDREDAEVGKRLTREAKLAASIDHPFICKVNELIHHDDGQSLLVMEYVDGRTLKDLLRDGPVEPPRVLRFARELAEAFGVAHRAGLIHRDIKPSNIMITTHGHVKVMDFGIAKAVARPEASTTSTLTEAGHVVGTPDYMSPEQAAGRPLDARSDVFSFGVVLYECLTDTLPYKARATAVTVAEWFASTPVPLPATVPVELRTIVMRCLEIPRERRFASFEAIRTALDTSTLLRLSVTPTDMPWIDRPRARLVWLAGVAALGVALSAAAWFWNRNGAVAPVMLEQLPFVTGPAVEEGARVSPDGTRVAFVSTQRRQSRLWIRSVDGSDPQPIGNARDALKTPAWSPSGDELAYLIRDGDRAWLQIVKPWGEPVGQPVALETPWRQAALVRWIGTHLYFSVSAADSNSSTLWRYDTRDHSIGQVTHEPDGMRFVSNGRLTHVDVNSTESRLVFAPASADRPGLWISDLDGRHAERLGVDPRQPVTPRWRGPGDARVVFIDNANGQSDIWEFDARMRRTSALTTSPLEEASLDVSRSGDVLVADTIEESAHLWGLDPDKPDTPRQMTADGQSDMWPSLATTGRVIFHRGHGAYVGYAPRDTDVHAALWQDQRIVNDQRLLTGAGGVLSPDGRRVAFLRWPPGQGLAELWVTDLDSTRQPVRIEERLWFPGTDMPTWEPGGQTVAWFPRDANVLFFIRSVAGGGFELVRADLDGRLDVRTTVIASEPKALNTADQRRFSDLAVSADGAAIGVVSTTRLPYQGGRLLRIDLDRPAAAPRPVLNAAEGSEISIAGWTPRGTLVAVVSSDPDRGSRSQIVEVDGNGVARSAAAATGILGFTARLDPTRDRVFATSSDQGVATVCVIEPISGRPRTLVGNDIDGITFGGYAIAPDGWLLYMRKEVNHNVWLFRVHAHTTQGNPGR